MSVINAVILCDGTPPKKQLLENALAGADLFIAADGGGNIARKYNLVPDLVIGDLDSFQQEDESSFEIKKIPGQETNDLEKALREAKSRNSQHVIVFGSTGKRVDHTLKNFSVLKQFHHQFQSILFRDNYTDAYLIDSPFKKSFEIGTQISLFPLSGKVTGVVTKGLKYPLHAEPLENGVRDGSSNEVTQSIVEIHYKKGDLLLFEIHNHTHS